MNPFANLGSGVVASLGSLWVIFTHGGWIVFVLAAVYLLYLLYLDEIQGQFLADQKYVFLSIKTPKENLASTLAIEQIFSHLYVIQKNPTFAETYVEGQVQLWYSLEIVSLGGQISFIIRAATKYRDLVEAAIYAQYPQAEIAEVADYMEHIEYKPFSEDIEVWGTEFKLLENQAFPIKTYRDFEHPTAEQKIIDPLTPLFEALAKVAPHEFYGIQILIRPEGDSAWKPAAEVVAQELLGEKAGGQAKWSQILLAPLNWFAEFSIIDFLKPAQPEVEKKERTFMNLSDVEKERVNSVQRKMSKQGFVTKIRHLYIAPKTKVDKNKKFTIPGALVALNSSVTNKLVANKKITPKVDYIISPTLEANHIEHEQERRKESLVKGYKDRSMWRGGEKYILNTEELATLFHLPLTVTPMVPSIQSVESKRAQAPANLPIAQE